MEVKLIITLPVIIIVVLVAATGYIILSKTANRKWGYTEEREKELGNASSNGFFSRRKKY